MSRLGFALLLVAAAAGPSAAASPDPRSLAVPPDQQARAQTLVLKLASAAFAEREEAHEELAKMGRLAKAALVEAVTADPDPEVRFRCRQLLPKAAAEDLRVRVETFLADAEGKFEHDVPGWNQFRKTVPNTAAARELFAEMLADETNRTMLTAVGGPPGELGQLIAARKAEFSPSRPGRGWNTGVAVARKDATSADLAAVLFAESQVPGRFVPVLTRGPASSTPASAGSIALLATTPGDRGAVYRAIVVAWVKTRDDALQLTTALTVAETLELKEGAEVAIRLLATPGPTTYRTRAASTLARLGSKEHLPALEKLMTDDTALVKSGSVVNGEQVELQVRDVALVTCVLITGQEPKEYGFGELYAGSRGNVTNWYLTGSVRAGALDKWKAWREKNPDFTGKKKD
jgi:hypothetical protein